MSVASHAHAQVTAGHGVPPFGGLHSRHRRLDDTAGHTGLGGRNGRGGRIGRGRGFPDNAPTPFRADASGALGALGPLGTLGAGPGPRCWASGSVGPEVEAPSASTVRRRTLYDAGLRGQTLGSISDDRHLSVRRDGLADWFSRKSPQRVAWAAAETARQRLHMAFARNTSSTSQRALVWDVHVPLIDARSAQSAHIHDGKVNEGGWTILIGAVNELPQAARKLGMALDASVFIPEAMLPAVLLQSSAIEGADPNPNPNPYPAPTPIPTPTPNPNPNPGAPSILGHGCHPAGQLV